MPEPRGYGNWRKPKSMGILNLSLPATIIFFGCTIVAIILVMFTTVWSALGFFVASVVALEMVSIKSPHGYSIFDWIVTRMAWLKAKRKKENKYIGGVLAPKGWSTCMLPGVLGATSLSEYKDSYDRPFALVHHRAVNLYSIVLDCSPDGMALVDQEQIDMWVARWGAFLADLSHEPGLKGASVVVETAPDTGSALRRQIDKNMAVNAPTVARDMLEEVVRTYPAASASVRSYVTLTFSAALRGNGRGRKRDVVARELAARIPSMTSALRGTGAGEVVPMTGKDLVRVIRCAYDPDATDLFAQADLVGEEVDLDWPNAGPVYAQAYRDKYVHDGAQSLSWEMTQAPRGVVRSNVLVSLLHPHSAFLRKRVTILYKPLSAAQTATMVDADMRHSTARMANAKRGVAHAARDMANAVQTAKEEAEGAGVEEFGMIVTVTVPYGKELEDAKAVVDSLSAASRIRLRQCWYQQDSAFATSLPLGVMPGSYSLVPSEVKGMLS